MHPLGQPRISTTKGANVGEFRERDIRFRDSRASHRDHGPHCQPCRMLSPSQWLIEAWDTPDVFRWDEGSCDGAFAGPRCGQDEAMSQP